VSRYILRRIVISIPVLLVVTMLVFTLIELAPGDVVDYFVDPEAVQSYTEEDLNRVRERLGLNDPAPVRYLKWIGKVAQGDLGYRFVNGDNIAFLLRARLKNTLLLMGTAIIIGVTVGISLGVFTALRQYSFSDFLLSGLSFVGISMPAFVSGIVGLYIFAVKLHLFPAGGIRTVTATSSPIDVLYHLILPAVILSLSHISRNMRYTRISMLEVIHQDYITTARAKGLRKRTIILRHTLRNALLPVVTNIGLSIPRLVVGAVFIETIFSWPGMGSLYLAGVNSRDYPLIMGANLVFAVIVLLANLFTDILYSVVDPRVRIEE